MYQLVPVISQHLQMGCHQSVCTFHVPEDFVLRGLIDGNESAYLTEIYKGGTEGLSDGEKVGQFVKDDLCYKFMPLEIPLAEGDLIKLCCNYSAGPKYSLLSDKFVELRRWIEYFMTGKTLTWSGAQPTIEDDATFGKRGDFGGIANAAYSSASHGDIIVNGNYWPKNTPSFGGSFADWVILPSIRSDQSGDNRYDIRLLTKGAAYPLPAYLGLEVAKVVSGTRTVIGSYQYSLSDGYSVFKEKWYKFQYRFNRNKIWVYVQCGLSYNSNWSSYQDNAVVVEDASIASGDYLSVPTGNGVKLAAVDIY
ncbi:MAG: hypothetical protein PHV74_00135 [Dehalococcoidia bacterium]|nr:hypothetical protein [Dehalococcoidia bacterium]